MKRKKQTSGCRLNRHDPNCQCPKPTRAPRGSTPVQLLVRVSEETDQRLKKLVAQWRYPTTASELVRTAINNFLDIHL